MRATKASDGASWPRVLRSMTYGQIVLMSWSIGAVLASILCAPMVWQVFMRSAVHEALMREPGDPIRVIVEQWAPSMPYLIPGLVLGGLGLLMLHVWSQTSQAPKRGAGADGGVGRCHSTRR